MRGYLLPVFLGAATLSPAGAYAASPLPIELNKLEGAVQGAVGCRIYFVVQNPDVQPIEQLRLDLVLFGIDGVIARRVAFDVAPLAAGKMAVRLFDMQGIGCDGIGRVLVNDVLACRTGGASPADLDRAACLDRLVISSRAAVPLVK